MTNAELDQLVAEARGWQSRWNAGRVTPRTGVLMGGLLGALTALREENERLDTALGDLVSWFAHPTHGVWIIPRDADDAIAFARQALNPTGDK